MKTFLFVLMLGLNSISMAGTCRLVVQTKFKDGKKKVSVEEISAESRDECKVAAQQRQINSDPENIEKTQVAFGFRELSVLSE